MSKDENSDSLCKTVCGLPGYVAPEARPVPYSRGPLQTSNPQPYTAPSATSSATWHPRRALGPPIEAPIVYKGFCVCHCPCVTQLLGCAHLLGLT